MEPRKHNRNAQTVPWILLLYEGHLGSEQMYLLSPPKRFLAWGLQLTTADESEKKGIRQKDKKRMNDNKLKQTRGSSLVSMV